MLIIIDEHNHLHKNMDDSEYKINIDNKGCVTELNAIKHEHNYVAKPKTRC